MLRRTAFTLIELLVVIGIVALLIGILLPTLRKAKMASQQTVCASNLRQMGIALLSYVNDNRQRFPLVEEPLWRTDGTVDFDADPADTTAHPQSFYNVMRKYLGDMKVLQCPGAVSGFPRVGPLMTYRVSAANNLDGQTLLYEQLFDSAGNPKYNFSLKYLNGRHYELIHVDPYALPFKLVKGAGPHYLARDLVRNRLPNEPTPPSAANASGVPPHPNRQYNQLMLDFSVKLERDPNFQVTPP